MQGVLSSCVACFPPPSRRFHPDDTRASPVARAPRRDIQRQSFSIFRNRGYSRPRSYRRDAKKPARIYGCSSECKLIQSHFDGTDEYIESDLVTLWFYHPIQYKFHRPVNQLSSQTISCLAKPFLRRHPHTKCACVRKVDSRTRILPKLTQKD